MGSGHLLGCCGMQRPGVPDQALTLCLIREETFICCFDYLPRKLSVPLRVFCLLAEIPNLFTYMTDHLLSK